MGAESGVVHAGAMGKREGGTAFGRWWQAMAAAAATRRRVRRRERMRGRSTLASPRAASSFELLARVASPREPDRGPQEHLRRTRMIVLPAMVAAVASTGCRHHETAGAGGGAAASSQVGGSAGQGMTFSAEVVSVAK